MSPSLFHLTSPEVAAALERSSIAVLPFGSVEQHGPHLPTGTERRIQSLLEAFACVTQRAAQGGALSRQHQPLTDPVE